MSTNFLNIGTIARPDQDRFATTGPHLDVRVIPMYGDNKGIHIDPATRPNLLANIFLGQGDDLTPFSSYVITSPFGPRVAPTEGASTNHKGLDYAIGAGVPIQYKGAGSFFSQNGVGVLQTTDASGNPYELEFFHTLPGADTDAVATPDQQPVRSSAKEVAQNYSNMSASQLNAEYDKLRNSKDPNALAEGMKMHKAYFGK